MQTYIKLLIDLRLKHATSSSINSDAAEVRISIFIEIACDNFLIGGISNDSGRIYEEKTKVEGEH